MQNTAQNATVATSSNGRAVINSATSSARPTALAVAASVAHLTRSRFTLSTQRSWVLTSTRPALLRLRHLPLRQPPAHPPRDLLLLRARRPRRPPRALPASRPLLHLLPLLAPPRPLPAARLPKMKALALQMLHFPRRAAPRRRPPLLRPLSPLDATHSTTPSTI